MIRFDPDAELTVDDVEAVARRGETVELTPAALEAVEASHAFLQEAIDEDRPIYGITTGFGPLADHRLRPDRVALLQRNLVYHLVTGVGEPFDRHQTRAILFARVSALSRGFSGVDPEALRLLVACLNEDLVPVVPRLGTVGASGDLTPLAHVALALLGEGEFWDGRTLAEAGLQRLTIEGREGLGLVNGTSAMTGLAALNGAAASRAWELALGLALLNAEVFESPREHFHELVGRVRPHPGQLATLELLEEWASDSTRLREPRGSEIAQGELIQEIYSIRCVPQILGAIRDQIDCHNRWTERELNSVTDNPLIDPVEREVVHAGNFMGQHVAFASDGLNLGVIQLAVHAERVIARATDRRRNGGLPPFLQGAESGLHSGFMGAQVTATALVVELRTMAGAASIQSISTNADNQDVVSMGTIAARRTAVSIGHLFEVLAIEAMVLTQAMEMVGGEGFSAHSRALAEEVRSVSRPLREDRPLASEISKLAKLFGKEG